MCGSEPSITVQFNDQFLLSLIRKWISKFFSIQWLSKTGLTFDCVHKLEKLVMAALCSSVILVQGMSKEWYVLKQHWKCSWLLASWDKILGRGRGLTTSKFKHSRAELSAASRASSSSEAPNLGKPSQLDNELIEDRLNQVQTLHP